MRLDIDHVLIVSCFHWNMSFEDVFMILEDVGVFVFVLDISSLLSIFLIVLIFIMLLNPFASRNCAEDISFKIRLKLLIEYKLERKLGLL